MSAILNVIGDALVKAQLSWMAEHGIAGESVSLTNHRYTKGVVEALTDAGYRILAPGELDEVTLERAAGVAKSEDYWDGEWDDLCTDEAVGRNVAARTIATAIRALKAQGGGE